MIFAHTLQSVLNGTKTQTRRLVKAGEQLTADGVCIRTARGRRLYQVGKTYAVQPARGERAVVRIRITRLRCESVGDISAEDARAEGFASPRAFLEAWRAIHGAKADVSARVWVIAFELERL
ncbi:MAG: ASCH domain-containing protein [Aggregatilineales bacterium]